MKIFVLRHGMTGPAADDSERELTPGGIEDLERVMSRRPEELANLAQIQSSPFGRVRQTAEIAGKAVGFKGEVTDNPALTKLSPAQKITESLKDIDFDAGDLLLVSHESSCCDLILWLTAEDLLIPNSSLVAIDVKNLEYGGGKLLWQESPNSSDIKRTHSFVDMF